MRHAYRPTFGRASLLAVDSLRESTGNTFPLPTGVTFREISDVSGSEQLIGYVDLYRAIASRCRWVLTLVELLAYPFAKTFPKRFTIRGIRRCTALELRVCECECDDTAGIERTIAMRIDDLR